MIAPCKGCQERKEGCHDRCPSYIHWKNEKRAAKEWCRQENKVISSKVATYIHYRKEVKV